MLKKAYFNSENINQAATGLQKEILLVNPRKKEWQSNVYRTGLLVTDMQEYFTHKDSHAFIPSSEAIIPKINLLIDYFREQDLPVLFTRHYNKVENSGMMGSWWQDVLDRNKSEFQLTDRIRSLPDDHVIDKEQYDAFHETKLEEILKMKRINNLVIAGVMTNLCCETTLRSAFVRGFQTCMPIDTTATYNIKFHFSTFLNLSFGFSPLMLSGEFTGQTSNL